ncbi:MAG: hypothetical protein KGI46_12320, partial [Alphaproteobacteria bacterium]|nr:hypothetical protein [Alphaproteobacteria bacterium]
MEVVLAFGVVVLLALVAWLFHARGRAVTDLAVAREQLAQAERRSTDYARLRQEMLDATKAAVLEPAQSLSSKLLDDYKRENAEAKKESEARLKKLAQPLVEHATKLNEAVAALHGQIQDKGRTLDTVMRALSSPG